MFLNKFVEIMTGDAPFIDRIMQATEVKLAFSRQMSIDFVSDFASVEAVTHHYHQMAAKNFDTARSVFLQAQNKGEIRSHLSIDFIMAILNHQIDLCEKPEFCRLFPDGESMVKQMSEMFLFGIVEHNKSE
jgi:hypothetical protein